MGFIFSVNGDEIKFLENSIKQVEFLSESPANSNARATDFGVALKVWGKMNFSLDDKVKDGTVKLAEWAKLESSDAKCYRKAEVSVVSAGQIVRRVTLENAFVMGYTEELDDETGVGTFCIHLKQKKDLSEGVKVKSGFKEG